MLVTARPGIGLDNLTSNLKSLRDEAFNLGDSAPSAQVYLLDYLDWANRAARMLGYQIRDSDLASLVLNRRYELILSSFGTTISPLVKAQRVVRDLVRLELDQRIKDFDAVIETLRSYQQRWNDVGDLVVLDTCFYVEHPTELKDTDLTPVSIAADTGDGTEAIRRASLISPRRLPPFLAERRTFLLLSKARGYALRSDAASAAETLLEAEHAAPEEVRQSAEARSLLPALQPGSRGRAGVLLRELEARMTTARPAQARQGRRG
jgi:hypothetical protein